MVKYLIEKNADVNLTDRQGSNALHYAALGKQGESNTAVVCYLIEQKKIDPSLCLGGRYNLLFLAVKTNNASLVEYIMKQYPEMALARTRGQCPAEFARTKQREEIAALIEQNTPK